MKTIILISCVSKKLDYPAKANNLYISTLFKYSYSYGKSLNPDCIFILSAKYGLVKPDEVIKPYNLTLNEMKLKDIKEWSQRVIKELIQYSDLDKDKFVFFAGQKYRKYLIPHIKNYKIPMQGLPIGKQLSWLKEKTKK